MQWRRRATAKGADRDAGHTAAAAATHPAATGAKATTPTRHISTLALALALALPLALPLRLPLATRHGRSDRRGHKGRGGAACQCERRRARRAHRVRPPLHLGTRHPLCRLQVEHQLGGVVKAEGVEAVQPRAHLVCGAAVRHAAVRLRHALILLQRVVLLPPVQRQ